MTTDPKFQPLVDDLKNWLELEKQKETAKAAGLNSVMDAFRPTANYLEQLGKELKNDVDQTISIGLIGRWKEGPDQKFTVRYEVNFKGQVCHALLFTVQPIHSRRCFPSFALACPRRLPWDGESARTPVGRTLRVSRALRRRAL